MAKRGYRGAHPHNDMKVSKNPSSDKYSSKLTTEYNKLGSKQKYDYIRTHYFFPQATMTISSSLDFVAASQITMSSPAGGTLKMGGRNGGDQVGNNLFQANGNALQASTGIRDIINTNFSGQMTASIQSVAGGAAAATDAVVVVTQLTPGPDGNNAVIQKDTVTASGTVTFNGAATGSFTGG